MLLQIDINDNIKKAYDLCLSGLYHKLGLKEVHLIMTNAFCENKEA